MSKRTPGLPRFPRDLYQTPAKVTRRLLPFLAPRTVFIEPCAASGLMVDVLVEAGHVCAGAWDIEPLREDVERRDALAPGPALNGAIYITNPPWKRDVLHPLITHLSDQTTFWALFDADWAYTDLALPFKPRLRKHVAVGRVKWIFPGSKQPGYDNAAWYCFTRPSAAPTEFYARGELPREAMPAGRVCYDCRSIIAPTHKWQLAERAGVPTTVHRCCEAPTEVRLGAREPAPMPLFEAAA